MQPDQTQDAHEVETSTATVSLDAPSVLRIRFKPRVRESRKSTSEIVVAAGALRPASPCAMLVDCAGLEGQSSDSRDQLRTLCERLAVGQLAVIAPSAVARILGSVLVGLEAPAELKLALFADESAARSWLLAASGQRPQPPAADEQTAG